MGTKINTDYYGAENAFVNESGAYISGNAKTSPYSIWGLVDNDKYTGGAFDYSAAPWGIGECSLSSDFSGKIMKTSENKLKTDFYFNAKGNTPLFLYSNSSAVTSMNFEGSDVGYDNVTRAAFKCRVDPASNITGEHGMISTLPVDSGDNNDTADALITKPLTYLNYNKVRILPRYVWVVLNGQQAPTKYYTEWLLTNPDSSLNDGNIYQIVGFSMECYMQNGTAGQAVTTGLYNKFAPSIQSNPLAIPDLIKSSYYGESYDTWVRTHRSIMGVGTWDITPKYNSGNYSAIPFVTFDGLTLDSDFDDPQDDPPYNLLYGGHKLQPFGQISTKHQVFDDVSYHWEIVVGRAYTYSLPQNFDVLQDGDTIPETGVLYPYAKLVIDDTTYATEHESYYYAIIHECAFMGFPVVGSNRCIGCNIGDSNAYGAVYLPVFNEHWITTGDFKTGAASLDLVNSLWGDVFSLIMPDYDPTYDPTPPPEPDDDYGYLNNKPLTNRVYSSNNRVYALTAAQYSQFINDINSLYLDDPDTGYASFQLDFKGTNPSDYIVGTYGYTFLPAVLIPNQQPEAIQIGAVTLPNAEGYRIAPSYIFNYRSLGEIDLTGAGDFKPFGDFRDFEPYTHIELYVPLCGNIELDPAAVVGHTIQIEIRFDIMTGNATACVYRDNQTLIATVAGQLAASLPLTSGRMGDYQNAVKSAENALKQNELKTTTAAASVAIGVGAALLAPETGGLSLAAYGAAITGGASLMSLSNQKNQIEYEIKHKQPSISVCSSANGAVAQNISSMRAVCYVKQCKLLSTYNAATYAHTVGHATVKNTTIGAEATEDSNSLIVCSNADLTGIPATAAEINAIQSLLTGGVYV